MSRYRRPTTLPRLAAFGVVAIGLVGADIAFNNAANPSIKGENYLASEGYTHITDGESSYINTCGKGIYARTYHVTAPDGQEQSKVVCFGLLGPYHPLFG